MELLANSITMCDKIIQPVLSVAPIFVQATCHDLPEQEVMGGWDQEGLQEASQTMPRCIQHLRGQLVPSSGHVQPVQPDSYSEGLGTIQGPHVPSTFERDVRHVCLQGRQQRFCCLRKYWGQSRQDTGAAHEVVFCNHADHLVSEVPSIPRQHVRMQVPYCFPSHTIPRWRLLPCMLIKPHDGGKPPLSVLEGKGKRWPNLPSPRLGTGMFRDSGLSELCFHTSLSLFSPRLAVSCSACLHWSRCVGVRRARDGSLQHRGLLSRSPLGGSCGRHGSQLAQASYRAFSSGIRVLVRLAGLCLKLLG